MSIGLGFDLHRLVPGRRLVLGGVEIPYSLGLLGHSDGDAALHALIDALLGAAGAGDIGTRFPDTDPKWKDASSTALLQTVVAEMARAWTIVNVDLTILAEEPKIGPHRDAIRAGISTLLGIDPARISLKAKTMEGLGPIGAREAIAALAAVQLEAMGQRS